MGQNNSSKSSIKNEVIESIKTSIEKYIKDFSNQVNTITNEVLTSMIQEAMAQTQNRTVSKAPRTDNIVAKGSDKILEQERELIKLENDTIIRIINSADSMNQLSDKIIASVNNAIENTPGGMKNAAALTESIKKTGGVEAFLDSIMGSVDKMVGSLNNGGSSDKTDFSSSIKSKILTDINNTEVNGNNIKNVVSTIIKDSIKAASEAKCNLDTSGVQDIDIGNIMAAIQDGQKSNVTIKQSVSMKSFNKCLIDLDMGTKIIKKVMDFDIAFFTPKKEEKKSIVNDEQSIKKQNLTYTTVKSNSDTMWECRLKGSKFPEKKKRKCPTTKVSCGCDGKTEVIINKNVEKFTETIEDFYEDDNDGYNKYLMMVLCIVIGYYLIKHLIKQ